jgi:predicted DNA-binding transcriptional regulator YafY
MNCRVAIDYTNYRGERSTREVTPWPWRHEL